MTPATPPGIHVLPPDVIEQIAAGEVVERPASVVKELVENSLDAGATRITIETEAGGKDLIRVADNGCGMTPEEVDLALLRHATSKLRTAADLFNIRTLGFRGEALPTIASVSDTEIVTRREDVDEGSRVEVSAARLVTREPAAAPVGTTITVRRLFFNVPARQKFLKSDAAEAGEITRLVQRLALSHPGTAFILTHDRREALRSPGSDDAFNTVVALLGRAVARDLVPVPSGGSERLRVSGFTALPTLSRSSREHQYLFVNGRFVRSPLFYRAVDDVYRARMPVGRQPIVVLSLDVDPADVDVNVHPSKIEVRFHDEPALHAAISRALGRALSTPEAEQAAASEQALPDLDPGPHPTGGWAASLRYPVPPVSQPTPIVGEQAPGFTPTPPADLPFASEALRSGLPPTWERHGPAGPGGPRRFVMPGTPPTAPPTDDPFADEDAGDWRSEIGEDRSGNPNLQSPISNLPRSEIPTIAGLNVLGQAQDLFILAEGGGRLWIIDQHVAHERILFDQLADAATGPEASEPLLVPLTLRVDAREALAVQEHLEELRALGFALDPFGPGQFQVRAVPRTLVGRNYEQALRDMVDELAELTQGGQVRARRDQVALAAAGRACKAAVKAGMPLTPPEMQRLLADLANTRNPYTCPHGRPVFLLYSREDVEALFGMRTCE